MEERIIDERNRLAILMDKLLWGEIGSEDVSTKDMKKIREMIAAEVDKRTRPFEDIAEEVGLREAEV